MAKFIEHNHGLETIHRIVIGHLVRGVDSNKHPFREMVMATGASGRAPGIRRVICRSVKQTPFSLLAYTDWRSEKITELQSNPFASLHFWHPGSRCQVNCNAKVSIHRQDELSITEWKRVQGAAGDSYNTQLAPGSALESGSWQAVKLREPIDALFFAVLHCSIETMEVLQLNRNGHMRCVFSYREGVLHKASFVVP